MNGRASIGDIRRYSGLTPPAMVPDIGVVYAVERVNQVDDGLDEQGNESTEFESVSTRFAYTVSVNLITRSGTIVNVPYYFEGVTPAGFSGSIPREGQQVLILYLTNKRVPVAMAGGVRWEDFRRLISSGVLPEMKDGEILHQATIRKNPMSYFSPSNTEDTGSAEDSSPLPGARVYKDFKGRLVMESRHYRKDAGTGAFARVIMGNPAATQEDDESQDFNVKDPSSDEYIAVQLSIAPDETSDPVVLINYTESGKMSMQFVKGWIGRKASEDDASKPSTTVEVDTEEGTVLLDAESIVLGRDGEESAVLGNTLAQLLSSLVDAIISMRQPVAGAGPTAGPPVNAAVFQQIKQKLDTALSKTIKVE